ncbi:MAG: ECF transporter S component [Oscillospiraceae bacterium]|nr:ECF transporter S component [Oscillospiraceae bacterium]
MRKNIKLQDLVQAGIFAALTALLTSLLHIPVGNGYIHCGDAVIYLAAVMIPTPYAVGAAAVGGMMADLMAGYAEYAFPTFVIKGLLALAFSMICSKSERSFVKQLTAVVVCGVISIVGYWLTGVFLYGGWTAQLIATVPGNVVQAIGSGAVYFVLHTSIQQARNIAMRAI